MIKSNTVFHYQYVCPIHKKVNFKIDKELIKENEGLPGKKVGIVEPVKKAVGIVEPTQRN